MSEQNPNFYIPRVALVASPVLNTLRGYSADLGTWATLSVSVDPTDICKVGSVSGIDNN